ncbi:glucosaminidase domain-containing protein [Acidovorax sp. NCPPB 2350]|nr:glucosaminidase domain-containing protein [Acidovorax sp. NCPPB 2350]
MRPSDALQAPGSAFRAEMERIALPLHGGSAAHGDFGGFFRQVQGEIQAYIATGQGMDDAAMDLSTQARWLRAQFAAGADATPAAASTDPQSVAAPSETQAAFLAQATPWAEEAAARLGVAPELVLAHAALESGWGRQPLRDPATGQDTHNYFGIKAGGAWRGEVARAATIEYEDGVPQAQTAAFRSYPDGASAFRDYARLLSTQPGYQGALNAGHDAQAFAQGLVRGGYATDPDYADKLVRVARQLQARGLAQRTGD